MQKRPARANVAQRSVKVSRIEDGSSEKVKDPIPDPPQAAISEEKIRLRAYQRWEAAGKPNGDGTHFWLEAEQELAAGGKN